MSDIFAYDDLTWPEVAELPRDVPLIIPLGAGYNLDTFAASLGNPARIGLLPSIPFGWRGSGLAIPEAIFGQYIANLLDSLRDDGFIRVYYLAPQGIDPQSFTHIPNVESRISLPNPSLYAQPTFLPPDSECGKSS